MTTRFLLQHPRTHAAALACALGSSWSLAVHADCIDDAASRHQVNATVLRAIGWQESRLQPQALGHNANGSIDVGAFQINSVHLSELGRYGIDRAALADGCTSAEVAAWHYRRQIERDGNSWQAVGAYHSTTPRRAAWYANRIAEILMRWRVLPIGAPPFAPEISRTPDQPPARRPVPLPPPLSAAPADATSPHLAASPRGASLASSMPVESLAPDIRGSGVESSVAAIGATFATGQELAYLPPAR